MVYFKQQIKKKKVLSDRFKIVATGINAIS